MKKETRTVVCDEEIAGYLRSLHEMVLDGNPDFGKMKSAPETNLNYFGIALCGAKKKVNKLTGSLPLLR